MQSSMPEHIAASMRALRIVWPRERAPHGEHRHGRLARLAAACSSCPRGRTAADGASSAVGSPLARARTRALARTKGNYAKQ